MDSCKISFTAVATGPDLTLSFYLDNRLIEEISPGLDPYQFRHEFADPGQEHVLEIKLSGKLPEYTVLDQQGNILQDRVIEIKNFSIDDEDQQQLFYRLSNYQHSNNEPGEIVVDKFFGVMGCNGTVRLEFETPIYLWLLQHM